MKKVKYSSRHRHSGKEAFRKSFSKRGNMARAQAAMEFLMTYGWAIIAVLISIAALGYFGVLNTGLLSPNSCILFPGLACVDSYVDPVSNEVITIVRNGFGNQLNPIYVNISGCKMNSPKPGEPSVLQEGRTAIFGGYDCDLSGSKVKRDIIVTYKLSDGIVHTRRGSLSSALERVRYPPILTLADDFNDNIKNGYLWRDTSAPDNPKPFYLATSQETGGQLRITVPDNAACNTLACVAGYTSLLRYDLTDSRFTIELNDVEPDSVGPLGDGTESEIYFIPAGIGANNYYYVSREAYMIKYGKYANGNWYESSILYSPTNDRWIRISHNTAAKTVTLSRSSGGAWTPYITFTHNPAISAATCVNVAGPNYCRDAGFDVSSIRVYVEADAYNDAMPWPSQTTKWDNVNMNCPGGC